MIRRDTTYEVLNPDTNKWEVVPENCRSSINEYQYKDGMYLDLSCEEDGDTITRLAPVRVKS
jgi:hypothetical protein